MRINAQALGAVVWLAFSGFLIWAGHDLGIGQLSEPGGGFLIFWGGVLIAIFAGWMVVESLQSGAASLASLWEGTRWGKVCVVVVALLVYAGLLSSLGFLLANSIGLNLLRARCGTRLAVTRLGLLARHVGQLGLLDQARLEQLFLQGIAHTDTGRSGRRMIAACARRMRRLRRLLQGQVPCGAYADRSAMARRHPSAP